MTKEKPVSDILVIEKDGALATVTLNRPGQFNALNAELREALRDMVTDIENDAEIRFAIIKGAGRGFCAGADLTGGSEYPVSDHIDREYKPFLTGIADGNKIYIAQVHGTAAGIGAALAMNCDLVTIADTATIYMAFAAIALIPDGGNTQLLLQNMGYHRAMQAILEGEKISASDCLSFGLVNKVFEASQLDVGTKEWARQLAAGAPLAQGAAKRLLRRVRKLSYSDAIGAEGLEQDTLSKSEDCTIGVSAFFKKEKPSFIGR